MEGFQERIFTIGLDIMLISRLVYMVADASYILVDHAASGQRHLIIESTMVAFAWTQ